VFGRTHESAAPSHPTVQDVREIHARDPEIEVVPSELLSWLELLRFLNLIRCRMRDVLILFVHLIVTMRRRPMQESMAYSRTRFWRRTKNRIKWIRVEKRSRVTVSGRPIELEAWHRVSREDPLYSSAEPENVDSSSP